MKDLKRLLRHKALDADTSIAQVAEDIGVKAAFLYRILEGEARFSEKVLRGLLEHFEFSLAELVVLFEFHLTTGGRLPLYLFTEQQRERLLLRISEALVTVYKNASQELSDGQN